MYGACSTHVRDENTNKILVGKLEGRDRSEDLGVDGKIILEWILGK
jgi:hypothetical protein